MTSRSSGPTEPNSFESPPGAGDEAAAPQPHRADAPPSLYQDRGFWGMTITQFLGAFNDSVFKQIVLLLCLTVVVSSSGTVEDKQFIAVALFSLAFILFSGIAGYWSDRASKRSIIIGCKIGEIVVMILAVGAFAAMAAPSIVDPAAANALPSEISESTFRIVGMPWLVLGVLFLMGTQSAIFGPAKYGILPEMVHPADLPRTNGAIQMTTFLALILGTWVGGILLDEFHQELWLTGIICVGIAVVGTLTSLAVRRTGVAQPNAPFHWTALAVSPETWSLLRRDSALRRALWVYSMFWFVAAIFPMAVNWLGKQHFQLSHSDTSFMLATVSVGIAAGFILAGKLSAGRVNFGLVRLGAIGLIVTLALISLPVGGPAADGSWTQLLGRQGSQLTLVFSGFFAGLFALPVQVFLQSRPPEYMKGRVIGTMNLVNWLAMIVAAVGFYPLAEMILEESGLPKFGMFGLTGLFLVPIALFYRPEDVKL